MRGTAIKTMCAPALAEKLPSGAYKPCLLMEIISRRSTYERRRVIDFVQEAIVGARVDGQIVHG